MILVIQVVRNQPATSISRTAILPPDSTAQKAGDGEQKIGRQLPAPPDSRIATGKNTTDHLVKVGLPGRRYPVRIKPNVPDAAAIAEIPEPPRAILLVRTSGSEREIAVPMVSVGAQPWFSVNLQTQDERGVRTAF
jgi:hypothetical protein